MSGQESVRKKVSVAVVSALSIAFSFWLIAKASYLFFDFKVPSGAVVAFATSECPDGWAHYARAEGRSIVGVSEASSAAIGQHSGASAISLDITNIPEHQHDTIVGILPGFPGWGHGNIKRAAATGPGGDFLTALTAPAGSKVPKPVQIEPPIVLLRYCMKV